MSDALHIPRAFLHEVLLRLTDAAEIKVTLQVLDLVGDRPVPAVALAELLRPTRLRPVVGRESAVPGERRLVSVLNRAVNDGALLRITVDDGTGRTTYYLPATPEGQALVERVRGGDERPLRDLSVPAEAEVSIFRPNVFALYEQFIGPLTPLLSERLRDAERSYPRAWIEAAVREAVEYNKRNWRYVEAILTRWEETGGPDGVTARRSAES